MEQENVLHETVKLVLRGTQEDIQVRYEGLSSLVREFERLRVECPPELVASVEVLDTTLGWWPHERLD